MRRGRRGRNGAQIRLASVSSGVAREARQYGIIEEQAKRLCTWSCEIAATLLPGGVHSYVTGSEVRFGRKGGLTIHEDGSWHSFEADRHGFGAISLVAFLMDDRSPRAVQQFSADWLQQHPGNGSHTTAGAPNDASVSAREKWNAAFAARVLQDSTPIEADSDVGINLRDRGLSPPGRDIARRYPNARVGEAGLIGILRRLDGRAVGVQVGYIDPQGRKSALKPNRMIFMAETNRELRAGAGFRIPARKIPEPAEESDPVEAFAREYQGILFFAEGLENSLSVHAAVPYSETVGLPGIYGLNRQTVKAKQKIIVVRDGDAPDSEASISLQKGLDHLLILGALVLVTGTPVGEDANSLLQQGGIAAVQALIATAAAASLSEDGEFRRLAAMPKAQYERERHIVAKRLGMRRVSALDDLVNAKREFVPEGEEPDELADVPWEMPVTDLAAVLDAALATLQRFVAAEEVYLGAAVVWAAHTHLVQSDTILLPITPRMLISAAAENSGKSTLLNSVYHLSSRGLLFVSVTAAALFRVVDAMRPTLFIDEADTAFARGGNRELLSLINSGFERGRQVPRVEEIDGERRPILYEVWGAIAMAAIGRLPVATTQSRCIVIPLRRAWAGEVPERLRPGAELVFVPLRRQLVRWAQDLTALPVLPKLPALDNRIGDNWEPLRQIADLAGGRWPALIAQAAELDMADSADVGSMVPLLFDIREVFGALEWLETPELLKGLLTLEEPSAEWDRINRGGPVTAVWLKNRLRGALPADASHKNQRRRWINGRWRGGYPAALFDEVYKRYLPTTEGSSSPEEAETSDTGNKESPPADRLHRSDRSVITKTLRERPDSTRSGQQNAPLLDRSDRSTFAVSQSGRSGGESSDFDDRSAKTSSPDLQYLPNGAVGAVNPGSSGDSSLLPLGVSEDPQPEVEELSDKLAEKPPASELW